GIVIWSAPFFSTILPTPPTDTTRSARVTLTVGSSAELDAEALPWMRQTAMPIPIAAAIPTHSSMRRGTCGSSSCILKPPLFSDRQPSIRAAHKKTMNPARGHCDPDVGAAVVGVRGVGAAAVSLGDRAHDRQPEPGAAVRTSRIRTGESIERIAEELRRGAAALVAHRPLDRPVA